MSVTPNFSWPLIEPTDFVTNLPADLELLADDIDADVWAIKGTADAALPETIIDAAGDLIYGTAADTAGRLAIGTAGQVLKVNAGATAPEWGTVSGGGYTLISTTSLTSGTSVTLSSIPSTYKHLFLTISGLTCSGNDDIWIRFNSDTGSNYTGIDFNDSGSGGAFNLSRLLFSDFASANADKSAGELFISDYLDTTQYGKILRYNYFGKNTAGTTIKRVGQGYYQGTSAISSLTFLTGSGSVTFSTGTLKLYGIS